MQICFVCAEVLACNWLQVLLFLVWQCNGLGGASLTPALPCRLCMQNMTGFTCKTRPVLHAQPVLFCMQQRFGFARSVLNSSGVSLCLANGLCKTGQVLHATRRAFARTTDLVLHTHCGWRFTSPSTQGAARALVRPVDGLCLHDSGWSSILAVTIPCETCHSLPSL